MEADLQVWSCRNTVIAGTWQGVFTALGTRAVLISSWLVASAGDVCWHIGEHVFIFATKVFIHRHIAETAAVPLPAFFALRNSFSESFWRAKNIPRVSDLCYKTQQQFNQTQNKQHSITAAAVMLTGYGVERERNNRSEQSVGLTELFFLSPSDITNLWFSAHSSSSWKDSIIMSCCSSKRSTNKWLHASHVSTLVSEIFFEF